MRRIYRPALDYNYDMRTHVPSMTVIDREPFNQFSGLLDANGNRLMVTIESEPVGFVVFRPKS